MKIVNKTAVVDLVGRKIPEQLAEKNLPVTERMEKFVSKPIGQTINELIGRVITRKK